VRQGDGTRQCKERGGQTEGGRERRRRRRRRRLDLHSLFREVVSIVS